MRKKKINCHTRVDKALKKFFFNLSKITMCIHAVHNTWLSFTVRVPGGKIGCCNFDAPLGEAWWSFKAPGSKTGVSIPLLCTLLIFPYRQDETQTLKRLVEGVCVVDLVYVQSPFYPYLPSTNVLILQSLPVLFCAQIHRSHFVGRGFWSVPVPEWDCRAYICRGGERDQGTAVRVNEFAAGFSCYINHWRNQPLYSISLFCSVEVFFSAVWLHGLFWQGWDFTACSTYITPLSHLVLEIK